MESHWECLFFFWLVQIFLFICDERVSIAYGWMSSDAKTQSFDVSEQSIPLVNNRINTNYHFYQHSIQFSAFIWFRRKASGSKQRRNWSKRIRFGLMEFVSIELAAIDSTLPNMLCRLMCHKNRLLSQIAALSRIDRVGAPAITRILCQRSMHSRNKMMRS